METLGSLRCDLMHVQVLFAIVFCASRSQVAHAEDRTRHLFVREANGDVSIPDNLDEGGQEELRVLIVNLLAKMYQRKMMPFNSPKYPHKRGVLDRLPLERFLDEAATLMGPTQLEQ